ncbi:hypothetical protein [Clostridium sp.]
MNLRYGTYNASKLETMITMLDGVNLCITGLENLNMEIKEAEETGEDPLSVEIESMKYYYDLEGSNSKNLGVIHGFRNFFIRSTNDYLNSNSF